MTDRWETHLGDCLERLKALPDASQDAVVTDPPAGIAFMGKEWDKDKGGRLQWVAWMEEIARECYRVLKPGGHALVWSIPRTSHWTGWAWENAGWQPRDMIMHLQAQGFPKNLNVSKAIDKAAGAVREVVGVDEMARARACKNNFNQFNAMGGSEKGVNSAAFAANAGIITAPATPEAARWEGWGTCLKPAMEGWWLFRKPLMGSVAENVLAHGTGAINIDGCRIEAVGGITPGGSHTGKDPFHQGGHDVRVRTPEHQKGRWPANLVLSHSEDCQQVGTRRVKANTEGAGKLWCHYRDDTEDHAQARTSRLGDEDGMETIEEWACTDDCPVRMLNEQSGVLTSGKLSSGHKHAGGDGNMFKANSGLIEGNYGGDSGGAARFFYTAKTSKNEKTAGGNVNNVHPTVKPLSLMRYLCRLITPPGGKVLDPFMGSGTTGVAALQEGFSFYGIEQDPTSHETANQRLNLAMNPGLWVDPVVVVEEKPMNLNAMLGFEDE